MLQFNPIDESRTFIGPDFGGKVNKWWGGVLAGNGVIYCAPFNSDRWPYAIFQANLSYQRKTRYTEMNAQKLEKYHNFCCKYYQHF